MPSARLFEPRSLKNTSRFPKAILSSNTQSVPVAKSGCTPSHPIMQFQRSFGNQAAVPSSLAPRNHGGTGNYDKQELGPPAPIVLGMFGVRQVVDSSSTVQGKFDGGQTEGHSPGEGSTASSRSGLPLFLRTGLESLSGLNRALLLGKTIESPLIVLYTPSRGEIPYHSF